MPENSPPRPDRDIDAAGREQTWVERFAVACRGVAVAVQGEASLRVHLVVTVGVLLAGAVLGLSRLEWCLVALCIVLTLSAELFNTAIEHLARAITREENPHVRDALDVASGAMLVIALGAVLLGVLVLGTPALKLLTHAA